MTTAIASAAGRIFAFRRPRIRVAGAIHNSAPRPVTVMADSTTKNDLLLRTAQGDRDAFSLLYDEVAPMVYGIALRVVRDPARAEEVSQEAFLQVWDHSDRFDPVRGTATAWIAAIAHRRAVDVVRSERASSAPSDPRGRIEVGPPTFR